MITHECLDYEPKKVRDLIDAHCKKTGVGFYQIRNPNHMKAYWAQNTLILRLAKEGLPLYKIHGISGCTQEYAQKVLNYRFYKDVKIKTQSWEAA